MKTALICSPTASVREKLQLHLGEEDYKVDAVASHAEALALLRVESRDVVISEARRDRFAEYLRLMVRMRPSVAVHLFQDRLVFCHYPMGRQKVELLYALDNAGLIFPGSTALPYDPARHPHVINC